MDCRMLWILVAVIHKSLCQSSSCSRPLLLPPANLSLHCEVYARNTIKELEDRIQDLESQAEVLKTEASCQITPNQEYTISTEYQDCREVAAYDVGPSGIYNITTVTKARQLLSVKIGKTGGIDGHLDHYLVSETDGPFPVYCDRVGNESWTVIMRRSVFKENFNRTFDEYKHGFGKANGDFWLGLEKIHRITAQPFATFSLWITIRNSNGIPTVFPYSLFKVSDESKFYSLLLTGYLGQHGERLFRFNQDVPFRCWTALELPYSNEDCYDRGHQRGGCWWFRNRRSRLCGDNNIHDINPFAHGFDSISYVDMRIKMNG